MIATLPFYLVPLTHPTWEEALACARNLPTCALPELRLDLFPEKDPEAMVRDLHHRCLVTCRRAEEYGRFQGTEAERLERVTQALAARPAWLDWEWDLAIPPAVAVHRGHTRLLRSIHVQPGVFDLESRLEDLPEGEAYKWVGHAQRLGENGYIKGLLGLARDRGLRLSAFLMGAKGIPSRVLQGAWGGSFTYAAPDDGPLAAPGQLPLATLRSWRCEKLHGGYAPCGVIGTPVLHSRGPALHNPRFQRAFKDLVYLPLDCGEAEEALEALEALGVLGLSITAPLKERLPERLGLQGPLNTLWRRSPGEPWRGVNTDAEALAQALEPLPPGSVLVLGRGGVGATSLQVLRDLGLPALGVHRGAIPTAEEVRAFAPVGVIQATSLGMAPEDPCPFPEVLEAALPSLAWAVEWVYKEATAFAAWAQGQGLRLVEGGPLFLAQAEGQSRRFIEDCG